MTVDRHRVMTEQDFQRIKSCLCGDNGHFAYAYKCHDPKCEYIHIGTIHGFNAIEPLLDVAEARKFAHLILELVNKVEPLA